MDHGFVIHGVTRGQYTRFAALVQQKYIGATVAGDTGSTAAGQTKFNWAYCPETITLTFTVTALPPFVSADTVDAELRSLVANGA